MSGQPRILSGIQPSGALHLGNYFGAIKQYIELQTQGEGLYFLANYHAMSTIQDPRLLHEYTHDAALDLLALGLDPNRAFLFRQSDVPELTELTWIFFCVTGKGLLDPDAIERIAAECEQEVLEARARFRERAKPQPRAVFDHMYETLPPELQDQKREYLEKLDRKGVE